MRVIPVSAKEADDQRPSFEPWPAGEYDFTVYDAADETSQSSGNEQIKLTLHVFNDEGRHRTVFDYLVNSEKVAWKLRHFAEAVGMTKEYERGDLDPVVIQGRSGRCQLRIKPASGTYPAGNSVGDYGAESGKTPAARAPVARPAPRTLPRTAQSSGPRSVDLDDEIPF